MKSLVFLLLFPAMFAHAGPIVVGTDLPTNAFGVGTVAGIGAGFDNGNCCTLAQAFTLNAPFQLDTLVLDLGASDTDQYTVWLTNAVGPSPNPSNVLFEATGDFVNNGVLNGSPTSFSTNLQLPSGGYYIVLSSTSLNQQQGWVLADFVLPGSLETLGQNGATGSGSGSRNAGFAPASTFVFFTGISSTPPSPGFAFQLTGTVIPEPASAALVTIGFAMLALGAKVRRGTFQ